MIVTIYTDTHEQSQELYDLCDLSELVTYNFVEDSDTHGIDITVHNIMEEMFALQKIQLFVCRYFGLKKIEDYAEDDVYHDVQEKEND